ncbi:hypothetical protein L1285_17395 [Pseudoalteromonas sp. DL2-H2.2]|uniref:hypothetical protein n=1 Tax=Pseudoalteromonas sp. DL2-H2.2 TaxID=2908889 RepID=UPI001F464A2E|nr:hypothetical protein [Pseudoalteromonas sp. DL2-H2.2]MCF2910092.1 hypothetical protein [Pseudoalteromonas sp. DL2-H2.2]
MQDNNLNESPELVNDDRAVQVKNSLRNKINYYVADSASLTGTATDIAHVLLHELSGFVNKLSEARDMDEVNASVVSMKQAIGDIETKVDNNELRFPYQVKGLDTVKEEVIERANGVSELL